MTPLGARAGRGFRSANSRVGMIVLARALFVGLALFWASAVFAEQDETIGESTPDLVRDFNDPLTTLPQVFIQDAYTPANYGTDAQTNRVILRAIVPRIPRLSLFPFVPLVRPTFSLVTVPTGRGSATRTELGDTQLFDFAVLPW